MKNFPINGTARPILSPIVSKSTAWFGPSLHLALLFCENDFIFKGREMQQKWHFF
jgi:hypothetical protein